MTRSEATQGFKHAADERFVEYYLDQSQSTDTVRRFDVVYEMTSKLAQEQLRDRTSLKVLDVGCGPGVQVCRWAREGHEVAGLDVSSAFIDAATERVSKQGLKADLRVGTATALPFADESFDVCLLPELLEHVEDWQTCVAEAVRVLRKGGVLYLCTTNALCPIQDEFKLPLYSWYPARLKKHFEQLARTTRPELVEYATYPAVHWFTYSGLQQVLHGYGMRCLNRFDMMQPSSAVRRLVKAVASVPPFRFLGQVATPWTVIFAIKERRTPAR
jgi:2-polyprenyl-6-hydroxyphenyl methylase/3-demethylubiquinone-9 3-methyltransferase